MNSIAPSAPPPLKREALPPKLLNRIAWLLWVIVLALLLAFCFFASSFCVTLVLAAFLAIIADPIVSYFERWHVPRSLSAALLIFAGMFVFGLVGYASYARISAFVDDVPRLTEQIRQATVPITQKIEKLQESASKLTRAPETGARRVTEVRVKEPTSWSSYVIRGVGPVWGVIIIAGVVPFMMYFCLIRKQQMYERMATSLGEKIDVPHFVQSLTAMVRGFAVGNLVIGSAMATATVIVLYSLQVQGAVTLGILSGFLNLVPFLGALLAAALPLAAALLQFDTPMPFVVISLTIIILHIISANILIPKIIGSRVDIGPAVATAGILFWGWLWGPIGVLLAVPLTATVKLVADSHPSLVHLSNLLSESRPVLPSWIRSSSETFYRAIPSLRKKSPASSKPLHSSEGH
jgi:predicted PurR-regulated permease PerM